MAKKEEFGSTAIVRLNFVEDNSTLTTATGVERRIKTPPHPSTTTTKPADNFGIALGEL
jgi:hypothetical protein